MEWGVGGRHAEGEERGWQRKELVRYIVVRAPNSDRFAKSFSDRLLFFLSGDGF